MKEDMGGRQGDRRPTVKKPHELIMGLWRLDRVSQRTYFWYDTTIEPTRPKKVKKTFRNPIIQAKEMQLEMEYHNLTKAQLARKLNLSRAW